jgi:hypothetical protein
MYVGYRSIICERGGGGRDFREILGWVPIYGPGRDILLRIII